MILSNNKIVLWTIITHAFIIIGAGHGIGNWFLLETAYIWELITGNISLFHYNFISIAIFLCLIGQSLLIISILSKKTDQKRIFHFSGLTLLWANTIFFLISIQDDNYSHFLYISALPFFIITLAVFLFKAVKKFIVKLYEKV